MTTETNNGGNFEAVIRSRVTERVRPRGDVLGTLIDCIDADQAVELVRKWALRRESGYVCHCNAHSVVTARHDDAFREILNEADLVTPDGSSVAWLLRKTGWPQQSRVAGPDLMWNLLDVAQRDGTAVYFFGSTTNTLDKLTTRVRARFPTLRIAGWYSPPFLAPTPDEDRAHIALLNGSGARIVFIGLGCPKQERWMAAHRDQVSAVMIGVGAAFDYHAGVLKRAPSWMRSSGLEWLHRLVSEPRRLGRRYVVTSVVFIFCAIHQIVVTRWRQP